MVPPPTPPKWLDKLANEVALRLGPVDLLAPIGCHYYYNPSTDQWEVTLFAATTECVGGEYDGEFRNSYFTADLQGVLELFSETEKFSWQTCSLGEDDDLGPHVSVEGRFEEHNVWLRILSTPPKQFPAGREAQVYNYQFDEIW